MNDPSKPLSDAEFVEALAGHIDTPCEVDVAGTTLNIRDFYLRELRRALGSMTDAAARARAEEILRKYDGA